MKTTYIIKTWTNDTGGNTMVDFVELSNGIVLTITDECVQAHTQAPTDDEPWDANLITTMFITKEHPRVKTSTVLEDMLVEQFMIERHGANPNYTEDSEVQRDNSTDLWIEVDSTPEVLALLNADYNLFVAPFATWAAKHDMYTPEVLSTETTITYKVNI